MESRDEFLGNEYLGVWQNLGVDTRLKATQLTKAPKKKPPSVPKRQPTCDSLEKVQEWIGNCQRCGLCSARNQIVFGVGNPKTRLMFVGEGPGADEDKQGLPFVGRAGQLLNKIIEAMGYKRDEIYIANVVKCRPPSNRVPMPEEIEQCLPFLKAQIEIIAPEVIVALGATAAGVLLNHTGPMATVRGRFHPLVWNTKIKVMPTYHPAYLLRNPNAKKIVWDDMKVVMNTLNDSRKDLPR